MRDLEVGQWREKWQEAARSFRDRSVLHQPEGLDLVLRALGSHGRAGSRREVGIKLTGEASSSKYKLIGQECQ